MDKTIQTDIETLVDNLTENLYTIKELDLCINETPTMSYYKMFSSNAQMQKDLDKLKKAKREALSIRYDTLETLKMAIEKELNYTSQAQQSFINTNQI